MQKTYERHNFSGSEYLPANFINFDIFSRQCNYLPKNSGRRNGTSMLKGDGGRRKGFRIRCMVTEKLEETKQDKRRQGRGKGEYRGFETFARNRKDIRAAMAV